MTAEPLPAPSEPPARPWERSYPARLDWREPVPERPLFALLDEVAARFPDHPCLDFLGRRYRYREVAELVMRAARGLQDLGVAKGTRVGLLLPNTPLSVIAYYAILKAGGTVVSYNPLYAEQELRHQIEDSGTEIMVTLDLAALYPTLARVLGAGRLRRVVVGRMADLLPFPQNWLFPLVRRADLARIPRDDVHVPFKRLIANDGRPAPVAIDPKRDLAALQYTGGTTGVPKGAMLTHANLYVNAEQCRRWFTLAEPGRERVLAVLPFFHALGMTGVMNFGLSLGAEIILLPRVDVPQILKTIHHRRPTIFTAVPPLYRALDKSSDLGKYDLSSLRLCVSGGDTLPPEVQEAFQRLTGCFLAEGYGLTEAGPVVACNPFEGENRIGSVGLPLPGTTVEILSLDDHRTPLPVGSTGEVAVAGPQVMAGYWQAEEATRAAFADGLLRTGDVGYLDEDGYLHLVDRLKDVIITSGFNVYPHTVEAALRQHPAVAEVAVVGEPHPLRGQVVKAVVVPAPGRRPSRRELLEFLSDKVSKLEMPRRIEYRDALPKSPVGKVLKKELVGPAKEAKA